MFRFIPVAVIIVVLVAAMRTPAHASTVTVDTTAHLQTMRGWEVVDYAGDDVASAAFYDAYIAPLCSATAEAGINRIRLETHHEFDHVESTNDNSDPFDINWNGFDFSEFDKVVDNLCIPLKKSVEALGKQFIVNLCLVEVGSNTIGVFHQDPDEYAEFVLAHFQHMDTKYGFVPDMVEVALEPTIFEVFSNSPATLAAALVAAGDRLKAAGYTPDFVAPSSVTLDNAISWFDVMIQEPGITEYWKEFSYHRYGDNASSKLQQIADRAVSNGMSTAMLEWWLAPNGYMTLHEDLTTTRNSAWQQGIPGSPNNDFSGWGALAMFSVEGDEHDVSLVMNPRTGLLRQYYKYVDLGAVRVDAATDETVVQPVAFVNPDGMNTVVLKVAAGRDVTVKGLPGGTYGITHATADSHDIDSPDVTIGDGDDLVVHMPGNGVITVFQKSGIAVGTREPARTAPRRPVGAAGRTCIYDLRGSRVPAPSAGLAGGLYVGVRLTGMCRLVCIDR